MSRPDSAWQLRADPFPKMQRQEFWGAGTELFLYCLLAQAIYFMYTSTAVKCIMAERLLQSDEPLDYTTDASLIDFVQT